jgi:hypothetical protein
MNDWCPFCSLPAYDWRNDTCLSCGPEARVRRDKATRPRWLKLRAQYRKSAFMKHGIHGAFPIYLRGSWKHPRTRDDRKEPYQPLY